MYIRKLITFPQQLYRSGVIKPKVGMEISEELFVSRIPKEELTVSSMAAMIDEWDGSKWDLKAEDLVALRTDEIMASTTVNDCALERLLTMDPIHALPWTSFRAGDSCSSRQ